jgi:hypothetical protein
VQPVTIALDGPADDGGVGRLAAAGTGAGLGVMTGWVGIAGMASLGAGAVHAAAIGVHAEHRPAAITFAVLALLQLGWGGVALVRGGRRWALVGALLNTGAVGGWVLAKASGISFIDGLDVAEPVQTADALAAGLALASVVAAVAALVVATRRASIDAVPVAASTRGPVMAAGAIAVSGLTLVGMVTGGTHVHAHGEADAGHAHTEAAAATPAVVPPKPYDPTKPIDLSGVPGVTPEQQAAAENLVAVTVLRLPQWSDPAVAEAAGFRSIGDAGTGEEHFVNQAFMADDVFLDPDQPESLVYDTSTGGRRLVAAMYMAKRGLPLEEVPNIGGKLMQWHTHENLCYNAEGKVRGLTNAAGECPPGLFKPVPTPMIHVWIEPHRCGPFAALEGIGGGRIPDGEAKLCDHVHGKTST